MNGIPLEWKRYEYGIKREIFELKEAEIFV